MRSQDRALHYSASRGRNAANAVRLCNVHLLSGAYARCSGWSLAVWWCYCFGNYRSSDHVSSLQSVRPWVPYFIQRSASSLAREGGILPTSSVVRVMRVLASVCSHDNFERTQTRYSVWWFVLTQFKSRSVGQGHRTVVGDAKNVVKVVRATSTGLFSCADRVLFWNLRRKARLLIRWLKTVRGVFYRCISRQFSAQRLIL